MANSRWTDLSTTKRCKGVYFSLPEFFDNRLIHWNFHVADTTTPANSYDMIIERDMMTKLGITLDFNLLVMTFVIPKKDGSVRFISNFRDELNKLIRHQPYPIPHIQDLLLKLEGFQYATSLDLNMGYYHIRFPNVSVLLSHRLVNMNTNNSRWAFRIALTFFKRKFLNL